MDGQLADAGAFKRRGFANHSAKLVRYCCENPDGTKI